MLLPEVDAALQALLPAIRPVTGVGMLLNCSCRPDAGPVALGAANWHGPYREPDALAQALYWHRFTRACSGGPGWTGAPATAQGFHWIQGHAQAGAADQARDRIYVATTAEGCRPVRQCLATRLDELGLPFVMKWLKSPAEYVRLDSLVLYVPVRARTLLLLELPVLVGTLGPHRLRREVPPFTRPIAPGVALGAGPCSGSFGMRCCQRTAHAVWQTDVLSAGSTAARLARTAAHFQGWLGHAL